MDLFHFFPYISCVYIYVYCYWTNCWIFDEKWNIECTYIKCLISYNSFQLISLNLTGLSFYTILYSCNLFSKVLPKCNSNIVNMSWSEKSEFYCHSKMNGLILIHLIISKYSLVIHILKWNMTNNLDSSLISSEVVLSL